MYEPRKDAAVLVLAVSNFPVCTFFSAKYPLYDGSSRVFHIWAGSLLLGAVGTTAGT